MKTMSKKLLLGLAIVLCTVSLVHADVVTTVDPSNSGWVQNDQSTWKEGVYSLVIQCTDNGVAVENYVANFTVRLMGGQYPSGLTQITMFTVQSTLTDSTGRGYISVPLMHLQKSDGSGYIHIDPFDDIAFTGGEVQASINSDISALGVTPGIGCYGLVGCCQTTITVTCCNPIRTFTYCTYGVEANCISSNPDPCTTITSTWNPTGVCDYCLGTCTSETAIQLSSFTARGGLRKVILQWNTETEINNAGFNILRAEAADGVYVKINTGLIQAKGTSIQGSAYIFTDKKVEKSKTYYYKLEDVDENGTTTTHGPVSATPVFLMSLFGK